MNLLETLSVIGWTLMCAGSMLTLSFNPQPTSKRTVITAEASTQLDHLKQSVPSGVAV